VRRGNGPRQPGGGRQIAGARGQDRGKPAGKPTGKSFGQRPGGAGRAAGKRRRPLDADAERGPGKSASGPRKAGRGDFADAVNPRPVAPLKGVPGKSAPRPAPRPTAAGAAEAMTATGVQTVTVSADEAGMRVDRFLEA
jgi:23S rRNA pseudouridine955/2504/2580 synthase